MTKFYRELLEAIIHRWAAQRTLYVYDRCAELCLSCETHLFSKGNSSQSAANHARNARANPFSYCTGFFYVHYTTPRTYGLPSYPKDEATMVKCLALGHTCHDRDNTVTTPQLESDVRDRSAMTLHSKTVIPAENFEVCAVHEYFQRKNVQCFYTDTVICMLLCSAAEYCTCC